MSLHQYVCDKCEIEFELNIGLLEGKYILFIAPTKEEEDKLWEEGKDPRDHWLELPLKGLPMNPPCPECGSKKTSKLMHEFNGWVKGNCFTNRERERKFYENGMDKKQAEEFYKESCKASLERQMSGRQHYKKVAPDMEYFAKKGLAKKTDNVTKKKENLKKINLELVKPYLKK